MSRAREGPASHEPAPLGVPLHVPLLHVHLAAQWGHQVQQRVLGGPAEERQQEGHAEARGALTLWAKSGLETLCQAEPDPLGKPIFTGRGSWFTPTCPTEPPCYPSHSGLSGGQGGGMAPCALTPTPRSSWVGKGELRALGFQPRTGWLEKGRTQQTLCFRGRGDQRLGAQLAGGQATGSVTPLSTRCF